MLSRKNDNPCSFNINNDDDDYADELFLWYGLLTKGI